VFYQRQVDSETEEYYSFARLSHDYDPEEPWVCIDIFFNNRTGETSLFFVYLGADKGGILNMAHSGRMFSLAEMDGIGIVPFAITVHPDGTRTWKPVADLPFILTSDTTTSYEIVACGEYRYYLIATDGNGNQASGDKKGMFFPC